MKADDSLVSEGEGGRGEGEGVGGKEDESFHQISCSFSFIYYFPTHIILSFFI